MKTPKKSSTAKTQRRKGVAKKSRQTSQFGIEATAGANTNRRGAFVEVMFSALPLRLRAFAVNFE
jgi:hypothetical protein